MSEQLDLVKSKIKSFYFQFILLQISKYNMHQMISSWLNKNLYYDGGSLKNPKSAREIFSQLNLADYQLFMLEYKEECNITSQLEECIGNLRLDMGQYFQFEYDPTLDISNALDLTIAFIEELENMNWDQNNVNHYQLVNYYKQSLEECRYIIQENTIDVEKQKYKNNINELVISNEEEKLSQNVIEPFKDENEMIESSENLDIKMIFQKEHLYPYSDSRSYIFISYAHKDIYKVLPFFHQLTNQNYRIWWDGGISPDTPDYYLKIEDKIQNAGLVVFLMFDYFLESDFCSKEFEVAASAKKTLVFVHPSSLKLINGWKLKIGTHQKIVLNVPPKNDLPEKTATDFLVKLQQIDEVSQFQSSKLLRYSKENDSEVRRIYDITISEFKKDTYNVSVSDALLYGDEDQKLDAAAFILVENQKLIHRYYSQLRSFLLVDQNLKMFYTYIEEKYSKSESGPILKLAFQIKNSLNGFYISRSNELLNIFIFPEVLELPDTVEVIGDAFNLDFDNKIKTLKIPNSIIKITSFNRLKGKKIQFMGSEEDWHSIDISILSDYERELFKEMCVEFIQENEYQR